MPVSQKYGVSEQAARVGQMIYLVAYAFASEIWAPWSEEFGRWPVLQLSLFLVNIWQILAALAPNFGSLVVARFLVSHGHIFSHQRLLNILLTVCRVARARLADL